MFRIGAILEGAKCECQRICSSGTTARLHASDQVFLVGVGAKPFILLGYFDFLRGSERPALGMAKAGEVRNCNQMSD
jgi:hypothetical protein